MTYLEWLDSCGQTNSSLSRAHGDRFCSLSHEHESKRAFEGSATGKDRAGTKTDHGQRLLRQLSNWEWNPIIDAIHTVQWQETGKDGVPSWSTCAQPLRLSGFWQQRLAWLQELFVGGVLLAGGRIEPPTFANFREKWRKSSSCLGATKNMFFSKQFQGTTQVLKVENIMHYLKHMQLATTTKATMNGFWRYRIADKSSRQKQIVQNHTRKGISFDVSRNSHTGKRCPYVRRIVWAWRSLEHKC